MTQLRPHILPDLKYSASPNRSPRNGAAVRLVVLHRWGVRFTDTPHEHASYEAVIAYMKQKAPGGDPRRAVSAHVVYPGSAAPGEATQLVPWHLKAWTEAYYNPDAVEVESADAIWLGHDPAGFHQLARITAYLLHHYGLPAVALDAQGIVHGRGFCRHADLGQLGGGHTSCPTTDPHLFAAFASLVRHEHARGGFRDTWGRP